MNVRAISAHVLTAAVTLAAATMFLSGRCEPDPVVEPPNGRAMALSSTPVTAELLPPPPTPPALEPEAGSIPAEVLARLDADERVNVRVYEAVNRGVVNIATASVRGAFRDEVASGTGSGFVIDREGHILTNYHVVEGADALHVSLSDGSTVEAEITGVDPSSDVAVLRVDVPAEKLWPLPLGESSNLLVGQKVLAVGNPFGLERTLTTGIISSLNRSLERQNGRTIKGIIQTDAAINPGNSGGPLLNSRGEVIGMNTAIYSQVGQSAGISFAVPINNISRVLKPLIEQGRVVRADLGIAKVYTLDDGLMVLEVVEGGPAENAGIQPIRIELERRGPYVRRRVDPRSADVIVAVDGVEVRTVDDLLTQVESHAPGEVAIVTVVRNGREREVRVRLGESS